MRHPDRHVLLLLGTGEQRQHRTIELLVHRQAAAGRNTAGMPARRRLVTRGLGDRAGTEWCRRIGGRSPAVCHPGRFQRAEETPPGTITTTPESR